MDGKAHNLSGASGEGEFIIEIAGKTGEPKAQSIGAGRKIYNIDGTGIFFHNQEGK